MTAWLLTYSSKDRFRQALEALTHQQQWDVKTITSFDFEEGDEIRGQSPYRFSLSAVTLAAGLLGIATAFGMQWYSSVVQTPLNVGGRPLNSWPAFIPPTFVLLILFAALGAFIFFFISQRLPWPSHPLFFTQSYSLSKNQFQILLKEKTSGQNFDPRSLAPDQMEEVHEL
jgi:hypothetical protein